MSQKDQDLANALDECLGAADPEAAAERYPKLQEELLSLIRTIQLVRKTPKAVPSPEANAAGRRRLLTAVAKKRRKLDTYQE